MTDRWSDISNEDFMQLLTQANHIHEVTFVGCGIVKLPIGMNLRCLSIYIQDGADREDFTFFLEKPVAQALVQQLQQMLASY